MRRMWKPIAVVFLAAVSGCAAAGDPALDRNLDPTDPSAPSAPATPAALGEPELRQDEFDREVEYAESAAEPTGGMRPAVEKDPPPLPVPAPATSAKKPAAGPAPSTSPALYVCPMHPEVTDDKPSKCAECGMTLILRKEKP
jgi:hypothetical protein